MDVLNIDSGKTSSFDRVSSNNVTKFLNKIRRFLLCKFSNNYVEKQTSIRKGGCRQCGKCCKLVYKCPFLVENGNNSYCMVYNLARPKQCAAFPINSKDLKDVSFKCGYSFDKCNSHSVNN